MFSSSIFLEKIGMLGYVPGHFKETPLKLNMDTLKLLIFQSVTFSKPPNSQYLLLTFLHSTLTFWDCVLLIILPSQKSTEITMLGHKSPNVTICMKFLRPLTNRDNLKHIFFSKGSVQIVAIPVVTLIEQRGSQQQKPATSPKKLFQRPPPYEKLWVLKSVKASY